MALLLSAMRGHGYDGWICSSYSSMSSSSSSSFTFPSSSSMSSASPSTSIGALSEAGVLRDSSDSLWRRGEGACCDDDDDEERRGDGRAGDGGCAFLSGDARSCFSELDSGV